MSGSIKPFTATTLILSFGNPPAEQPRYPPLPGESRPARDLDEAIPVQRVEVNIEPAQPCGVERFRMLFQKNGVRSERKVLNARDGRELRDQDGEIFPYKRFAAGNPQFIHAKRDGYTAKRSISSKERISSRGINFTPSSGMQ